MSTENNTVSSNQEYDLASIKDKLDHALGDLHRLRNFINAIELVCKDEADQTELVAFGLAVESDQLCAEICDSIDLISINLHKKLDTPLNPTQQQPLSKRRVMPLFPYNDRRGAYPSGFFVSSRFEIDNLQNLEGTIDRLDGCPISGHHYQPSLLALAILGRGLFCQDYRFA